MKCHLCSFLFAALISTEVQSQTETCPQNSNHPDLHTITQTVGSETVTREYILHVPSDYDENTPAPLIINMHGFGDCASDYSKTIGDSYNFAELADAENIIVAYPQGAYRSEKEDTYWEPGDSGLANIYDNDIYFIEELISQVGAEYNLNPDMIYACGYSNGGMMAYSLACNRSDIFAAIGIMSGTMLEETCLIEQPVPIIKFHGIEDDVLPYNGNIYFQSVEQVVNFWLDQNEIPKNSLTAASLNGGHVRHENYYNEDNTSCFSLYTINEEYDKPGGHVWFSEEIEGRTPNRIMWDFFADNCMNTNSTDEQSKKSTIVYPNPFTERLEISNALNQEYRLYDLNGMLIQHGIIGSNRYSIDVIDLQAGFYTLKIGGQTTRIIKIE